MDNEQCWVGRVYLERENFTVKDSICRSLYDSYIYNT